MNCLEYNNLLLPVRYCSKSISINVVISHIVSVKPLDSNISIAKKSNLLRTSKIKIRAKSYFAHFAPKDDLCLKSSDHIACFNLPLILSFLGCNRARFKANRLAVAIFSAAFSRLTLESSSLYVTSKTQCALW